MTEEVKAEVVEEKAGVVEEVKAEVVEEKAGVVEEAKVEEQAVAVEEVVSAPEVIVPPAPPKKTPQELNKEMQGERKTTKKKIQRFTREECFEELKRLERKTGHKNSKYYADVKNRALSLYITQV